MTWHDLIKKFKGSSKIDAVQQRQMDKTTNHWRHVLERLFSIIKFHASQNVALRGTSDKLYDDNNGCFLKIMDLLAKFDPVMKGHIRRIKSKEIYRHYLVTATKKKSESRALLQKIDFKLVCCLITWYDVLSQIEISSNSLQEVNLNIPQAVLLISNTLEYVKDYRTDEQIQKMLETARKLSVELDIESEFEKKRCRTKKRIFAYESQEESMTEENNFKINFFNSILDHAIGSFQDRFEMLMQHNNQFNFLYSLNAKDINEDELLKRCMDLEKLLYCNELKDVSGTDLFEEMKYLRNHYKGNYSPRNILNLILQEHKKFGTTLKRKELYIECAVTPKQKRSEMQTNAIEDSLSCIAHKETISNELKKQSS
ncbi:uncharacterized protein LOC136085495 [Hydra vulgaris]|uniref:Uncharacterized protein LOC136085495 n=1 Tax=Hydra vulgaris TaxID=6087 RepID=A0ABM4CM51_HYDVU